MKNPIPLDELMEAMQNDEMVGWCINCGCRHEPVEPDARKYTCEACEKPAVYGASEIIMGVLV
tara:strand:+ start:2948 stop:3136 length:189 start_codon:yes stop_codon:yes gene_type:complete